MRAARLKPIIVILPTTLPNERVLPCLWCVTGFPTASVLLPHWSSRMRNAARTGTPELPCTGAGALVNVPSQARAPQQDEGQNEERRRQRGYHDQEHVVVLAADALQRLKAAGRLH